MTEEMTEYTDTARPVLITGGTGFIASYLAMDILEKDRDETVVLFDRNPDFDDTHRPVRKITGFKDRYEAVKDRITFVQGDLSVFEHVLALFDTRKPKSVYHLGALLSAGAAGNPTMGFQVDLVGSWYVMEAARLYCQRHDEPPIKYLFPSSIASFGDHIAPELKRKVPNEAPQYPTSIYGVSKVDVERLGEYYHRNKWVDFRAVRFPSLLGAARGPGGTTAYSTLLVQEPARGHNYSTYVHETTAIDVLYVKDAVYALRDLHDAPDDRLGSSGDGDPNHPSFRRSFNIAGIRVDGSAPTAGQIVQAFNASPNKPANAGQVTFVDPAAPNPATENIVHTFGILDDSVARAEWWGRLSRGPRFLDLQTAVDDFVHDVVTYPDRIINLELFG